MEEDNDWKNYPQIDRRLLNIPRFMGAREACWYISRGKLRRAGGKHGRLGSRGKMNTISNLFKEVND